MKENDKVRFVESTEAQVNWGSNDDPAGVLVEGQIYTIKDIEEHSYHTKIYLQEVPGKFNSVSFELV